MTGYQEMLTDPSYGGQILVPTYPMIGNYGTSEADVESTRVQVTGFVVREDCDAPSHPLSEGTVHDYLSQNGSLESQVSTPALLLGNCGHLG